MTEEEKNKERQFKADRVARLQALRPSLPDRYRRALSDTDPRIGQYVFENIDRPERHNLYEVLAVERFLRMLDKYDWNAKRVRRFFKFYETLRFNGATGRQRYKLTPVQAFQFANIFGFSDGKGRRLTRTAYIFVPRKFSKTTSAASLAVYDLLFGDNNAQAYVGANSYEQAKICFDEIRAIMRDIDPGEKHFRVNREKITFKDRGRDSLIRCLTANAKTQDGLHASLVIMDEYAQARNTAGKNGADLKNVLTSSMGPRREPLTVIITTASDVTDGPFAHELEGVKKVLRGEAENDTVFAALFMPDVDDEESDPATWRKVQPHLGITVQPDFYEKEWADAQLSAENMLTFRTKMLNIFAINEEKAWFSYEKARELAGDFDIDAVGGHPDCAVAFDLSVHDDFSAVTYTLYSSASKRFYSHTDYYFPQGALKGHPNEQLYRLWHEAGHLKLCQHPFDRRGAECPDPLQPDARQLQPACRIFRDAGLRRPAPDRAQRQPDKQLLPGQLRDRRGQHGEQEAHEGGARPEDRRGHHAADDLGPAVHLRALTRPPHSPSGGSRPKRMLSSCVIGRPLSKSPSSLPPSSQSPTS